MLSGTSTSPLSAAHARGGALKLAEQVRHFLRPRVGVHLPVARSESAWTGIILNPAGRASYELVDERGPALLWLGAAVAALLDEEEGRRAEKMPRHHASRAE